MLVVVFNSIFISTCVYFGGLASFPTCSHVAARLERNGDGKISMKEFQKWNPEFADVVASKQVSVLSPLEA